MMFLGGDSVSVEKNGRLLTVLLNRPDVHNAFNSAMIARLYEIFTSIPDDGSVRAVILSGNGKSFSAGADLAGMKAAGQMTREENIADALKLADMLSAINNCAVPVIAVVHGAVMGGGIGLAACCDSVFCASGTRFALSEVKLGLIPGAISPYVIQAIGLRWARRLFVTGELFDAQRACSIGLVHDIYDDKEKAMSAALAVAHTIANNGPQAVQDAKKLAFYVAHASSTEDALRQETAARIAHRRGSAEGLEGISAFLEKRSPDWITPEEEDTASDD